LDSATRFGKIAPNCKVFDVPFIITLGGPNITGRRFLMTFQLTNVSETLSMSLHGDDRTNHSFYGTKSISALVTLLVGGLEHFFSFSIYWEIHHPN